MRNLILLILVLSSAYSKAETDLKFSMYSVATKKYEEKTIAVFKGVKVSKDCLNSKSICFALKAAEKKLPLKATGIEVAGNPAARYCHSYKAENRILKNSKNQEYDYCVFSDGSLIDSWSLYNKHYGK